MERRTIPAGLLLALAVFANRAPRAAAEEPEAVGPREDYRAAARELEALIVHEMEDKGLPAVSIALVEGGEVVWARGFGLADPEKKVPATAGTVYRVGSVSKLFTDLAVMQLVERGALDLDAPVETYFPEFRPANPFGKPVTLRLLLSHRSGLVREPPLGSYFDSSAPPLAETVQSLSATRLVYAPGTRTKYSNAGIAVAGRVLERALSRPFAECMEERVLRPLGVTRTAFRATPEMKRHLAHAVMWTRDGRVFPAPLFELGTSPAGNLYSTVLDLSKLLTALFAGGKAVGGRLLREETLAGMWKPQTGAPGKGAAFGLGFMVSELEGRLRVGHSGAIYGFATELAALPEAKLGVSVVATKDVANLPVRRIADQALRFMLLARERIEIGPLTFASAVDASAAGLAGVYEGGGRRIELLWREGKLHLAQGGLPLALRSLGGDLIADDPVFAGPRLTPRDGGIAIEGALLSRAPPAARPAPPPAGWLGLIGEYGWDHNTLYVLEKEGRLHALIEWFFLYPLEEESPDVFAFPDDGLYAGEKLVFTRDGRGLATRVEAASVAFPRRQVGAGRGATFRIEPRRPIGELRKEALLARPPEERGEFRRDELVDLEALDPTIRLDVRYATTNNFLGTVFYPRARALLLRPAAEALLRVHRKLKQEGYGLLIHDAYRPWHVTRMFWDATPDAMRIFVADPAKGSRHNRGAAVDLTLSDLATGEPADMVSGYDEFSPRAFPDYPGGTSLQRWRRELLRRSMEAEGFTVYTFEWWHFDFRGWERYPLLNLGLDEVAGAK